jgi:hypothetical protein
MGTTDFTVYVREYRRVREGMIERVRSHIRGPRKYFRKPRL